MLLLSEASEEPMPLTFKEAERSRPDVQDEQSRKKQKIVDDFCDDPEEDQQFSDILCAICDAGGTLLRCQGGCLRSFHATGDAGIQSKCRTLGYTDSQVKMINNFVCKNCEYKRHQCFVCGVLGSSDNSVGVEVISCVIATCGNFYHAQCVANLLYQGDKAEAIACQKKIESGEIFICPVHKCSVCNEGENMKVEDMQFAMCRRCPRSFHKQCLPRELVFDGKCSTGRVLYGVLPNRILIYCMKHEMDEDLKTPKRNHLIFPEIIKSKKVVHMQKEKVEFLIQKKCENSDIVPMQKIGDGPLFKSAPKSESKVEYLKNSRSVSCKVDGTIPVVMKNSYEEKMQSSSSKVTTARKTSFPVIRKETENKMKALWDEATASVTLEEVMKNRKMPSTYQNYGQNIDKSITLGMIEGSVKAVRSATKKLEYGGDIEDAKSVCQPEVLKNLWKWDRQLKVYLAPFLHGERYTSFGRHFTKVDRLMQIADKIQSYVQEGDTVVDFCCGANDFSILINERLDETGKSCFFKNYDLIRPKQDFCFEKRDWMTVERNELPSGSQLIMGLNPPFGVKAALANRFINKALTFEPKLLILIVPPWTERLSRKEPPYDLIWEDNKMLAGESFYFPGTMGDDGHELSQWNKTAPVLSLWSRQDWTQHHKEIAFQQGHLAYKSASRSTSSDWRNKRRSDDYRKGCIHKRLSDGSYDHNKRRHDDYKERCERKRWSDDYRKGCIHKRLSDGSYDHNKRRHDDCKERCERKRWSDDCKGRRNKRCFDDYEEKCCQKRKRVKWLDEETFNAKEEGELSDTPPPIDERYGKRVKWLDEETFNAKEEGELSDTPPPIDDRYGRPFGRDARDLQP